MIKICKDKTIKRWSKIGISLWYGWNLSFILSILIPIFSLFNKSFTDLDFALVVNAVFSGVFMIGSTTIFSVIKEKQKLFGWNENC